MPDRAAGDRKASHEPKKEDEGDRRSFGWSPKETWVLLKQTGIEWIEDKSPKQAAALAYYTLFALGPLLLLAIGFAGLLFGDEAARAAVMRQLEGLLGPAGAEAIGGLLQGADREWSGVLGTVAGLVILLVAAAGVFGQLKEALNRIWEVAPKKVDGWKAKVMRALRKNFLSFAGVFGVGFLLLVSLLLSAALAALGRYAAGLMPGAAIVWQVLNFLVSLAIISFVFAAIFKFLPDVRVGWRDVALGGAISALLFVIGQFAIGYYLTHGGLATRYGAASAVIVVLVWVYYSSMIVFFGAEFTQVYANFYGARVRPNEDARPLIEEMRERQAAPQREGIDRRGGEKRDKGRGAT